MVEKSESSEKSSDWPMLMPTEETGSTPKADSSEPVLLLSHTGRRRKVCSEPL